MESPRRHKDPKAGFPAYAEGYGKQQKASHSLKVMLVTCDCILLGLQPVLVHMSKNSSGKFSFDPVSVNFLTELTKTVVALCVLLVLGTGQPGPPMYRSLRSFLADARHNRLLAIPASLYAINNYLKFAMQLYFRPTTTKMLGNLKIFTIALLMRMVMKRRFTVIQWEALFLLLAGITVNQLHACAKDSGDAIAATALPAAIICTLGSITVPSAASVYNEFALKKHMDTSVHLQNFFLYFYGTCFNFLGLLGVCFFKRQSLWGVFHDQSLVTFLLIVNNAAQGILSSFFFKFADTILKKYSSTIATIFTAIMSWMLFAHPLTVNFGLGVSIVFVSMHQFFSFGDKSPRGKEQGMTYSPSLDRVELLERLNGQHSKGLLPR